MSALPNSLWQRCTGQAAQLGIGAELKWCDLIFLPKRLNKAGTAVIAGRMGDLVHAQIGMDQQF